MKRLLTVFFLVMSSILGACGTQPPPATTPPSMGVEIQNIEEGEAISLDLKQVKRYDQCDSDSVLKTQIQFSQSDTDAKTKELTLGAKVSGGADISGVAKVQLEGSIQDRFASVNTTSKGYNEVLQIEIPAHTFLEYTIIGRESRQEGTIEYTENGEPKKVDYSYRIGLQLDSSSTKKIPCPTPPGATETLVAIAPSDTPTPQPKTWLDGCLDAQTWHVYSTDTTVVSNTKPDADGCYPTGLTGMNLDPSGILHIVNWEKKTVLASGIYTPITETSVIDFKVYVTSMYLVYDGPPTYLNFAVAPADDPMDTKNTTRFKLQVEKTGKDPIVFYVMADSGETSGVKVRGKHNEYRHVYDVRLELNGSTLSVSIDDVPFGETLILPSGPKVFYIGYNLPVLAGINAQVSELTIDGVKK